VRNSQKGDSHGISEEGRPEATASFFSPKYFNFQIIPDHTYRIFFSPISHYFAEFALSN